MSLTSTMRAELVAGPVGTRKAQVAEVAATLRFGGGRKNLSGRTTVEADLSSKEAADRLRALLNSLYGLSADEVCVRGSSPRKGDRYVVRVVSGADELARRVGLVDANNRPVAGMSPRLIQGSREELVALWRGAFIAKGSLMEPKRSASLEVTAPTRFAAQALAGCASRLGITAKPKEVRGIDRVAIREADGIGRLIRLFGAKETYKEWEAGRRRREARGSANRLANFEDANLRRSARAAVVAGARVQRAFEILGDSVPDHLKVAGELRVANPMASLEELGQKADPALTKDAVAGRIRRLLAMADKVAHETGIDDTESGLNLDLLDDDV